MAYDSTIRTMRDGTVTLADGSGTPITCTIACDEGNFNWTETTETNTITCRGSIVGARTGDDQNVELNLTMKWSQLIQKSETVGDPSVPYEMINFLISGMTSTLAGVEALKWTLLVEGPAGTASTDEEIVFAKVCRRTLRPTEGKEFNAMEFTGVDYEIRPTISRV